MPSMPRLELTDEQRKALERSARAVERTRRAYEEAKQERNALIARMLTETEGQHGSLAAIARAADVKLETVRLIRRGSWR